MKKNELTEMMEGFAHTSQRSAPKKSNLVPNFKDHLSSFRDSIFEEMKLKCRDVEHVNGFYIPETNNTNIEIDVFVKEHGQVNRSKLFEIEEILSNKFNNFYFRIIVRAHQGRDINSIIADDSYVFIFGS